MYKPKKTKQKNAKSFTHQQRLWFSSLLCLISTLKPLQSNLKSTSNPTQQRFFRLPAHLFEVSTVYQILNLNTFHPYSLIFHMGFLTIAICSLYGWIVINFVLFCFCLPFGFAGLLGTKPIYYSFWFIASERISYCIYLN